MEHIEKKIVMAREIAQRWLAAQSTPEYRLRVLYGARDIRNLPNLLRAFRDRKAVFQEVPTISDLGLQEGFDYLDLWSSDRDALLRLQGWLDKRGYETSGVW